MAKETKINWELVDEWNEMEPEERKEWANFQEKLVWMLPIALLSMFVEGGYILTAIVAIYTCYGFTMKKEYREYIQSMKKIAVMRGA